MAQLTIDKRALEVSAGTSILEAAEQVGIEIPTLCYVKGLGANTSCMVCVVKVNGGERLLPACGTKVEEGMEVKARRRRCGRRGGRRWSCC